MSQEFFLLEWNTHFRINIVQQRQQERDHHAKNSSETKETDSSIMVLTEKYIVPGK